MGKLTKLCIGSFLAVVATLAAGCATTPEASSGPQACLVVDNSEGSGVQSRIFLVGTTSGWRQGMGEVGMGRTLEYCADRITIPERVHIVIERPAVGGRGAVLDGNRPRPVRSRQFVLRRGEIWTWNVNLNQLSRAVVF